MIIGVSGSSAPHLAFATLKALHNHPEIETHLVVSRGEVDVDDFPVQGRLRPVRAVRLQQRRDADKTARTFPTIDGARWSIPKAFIRVDKVLRSPSGKADYRWAKTVAIEGAVPA